MDWKPIENIALFDLDGTLADFDTAMKRDMVEIATPGEEKIDPWDRSKPWIKARKSLIMRQPGWWENLRPLQLGFDILEMILKLDFEVHVLTKGPSASAIAWGEKVEWCKSHLPKEVKITITEDKGLVYGKVLVDDWPKYIERWLKWRPRGLVIMPAHEHNKDFKHPNVIRYDGTSESYHECGIAINKIMKRKAGQELMI